MLAVEPVTASHCVEERTLPLERGLVKTPYGYIHYRRAGRAHARTVVISHINQQSSALMIELLEALGRKVQAIAIDYPSCGMSDHVYNPPTNGIPYWVTDATYLDPQDGSAAQFIAWGLKPNTSYSFRVRSYSGNATPVYGSYSGVATAMASRTFSFSLRSGSAA